MKEAVSTDIVKKDPFPARSRAWNVISVKKTENGSRTLF